MTKISCSCLNNEWFINYRSYKGLVHFIYWHSQIFKDKVRAFEKPEQAAKVSNHDQRIRIPRYKQVFVIAIWYADTFCKYKLNFPELIQINTKQIYRCNQQICSKIWFYEVMQQPFYSRKKNGCKMPKVELHTPWSSCFLSSRILS